MDAGRIEELVAPLLTQEAAELVDLEFFRESGRQILRFYLDKEGGITLDDCEHLSNRIGALLDEADAVQGSYVLEVSSPGLDRIIKKEKDFIRFAGKAVQVRLKVAENGRRNFKGLLRGWREGKVLLQCEGKDFEFPLDLVDEARLDCRAEV
ncbi:MAG TPA: ribosome maturation factor RimP [Elusimicrobia bacterium]|nr:ribosome maturation factor RimP [Elusimicrobiota bacterium]HBT61698.1 ribosome maturation factor RimP [Elusimicrobiota bacterium]